ncbi:glycosyl transferase [Synechococcus sp. RSCCF101]|uniref:glycosyl transferase n=1 Tax=Synechococcus sp. RSCCF101 TaxID=2511069 RepID=UPI00177EC16E|nr:glycosyl transferase [Synechococcus sp. RSCCF101]
MDFLQDAITTVHDYGRPDGAIQAHLQSRLRQHPTWVLIPCLFEEFQRPALTLIRDVLREFTGLGGLLIALAAEAPEEVEAARAFFADVPFPVRVLWTNGPAVRELLADVHQRGLDVLGPPGKGWAVWQGLGVASLDAELIALFDADIRTFSPAYPLRMLAPLLEPSDGIAYVKAFYSRLSVEEGRLHGRATRLFVSPVLQSLEQLMGASPFLRYLQSFRYPLAGEFAFTRDLAMNLRIPCDWGLEIGLLSEVYRHVAICRIAQVDLGIFDHKHKAIGAGPDEGLQRMCREILASLLRGLMEHESRALTSEQLSALEVVYRRVAEDRVRQHAFDARLNGLPYDRHGEENAVKDFTALLRPGCTSFMERPSGWRMPSWSRALAFDPGLRETLRDVGSSLATSPAGTPATAAASPAPAPVRRPATRRLRTA